MLVAIKKYEFYTKKTIINQQDLKSVTGLKLFLGFYNYYQRFITNQLNKIKPFTKIIIKIKSKNRRKSNKNYLKRLKISL